MRIKTGNKILLFLLTAAMVLSLLPGVTVYANNNRNSFIENSFYCPEEKQNEIYEITQRKDFVDYDYLIHEGLHIIKESIAPRYVLNMFDFGKTGNFEHSIQGDDGYPYYTETEYYTAKLINSEGEYAGNLYLTFRGSDEMPSASIVNECFAPFSYADHAERIKNILKYDEYIPEEFVKLVTLSLPFRDHYFYINDGTTECFINVGMLKLPSGIDSETGETVNAEITDSEREYFDTVITVEEMHERAVKFKESVDEEVIKRAQWAEEHPDEEYPNIGAADNLDQAQTPVVTGVKNIVNIRAYLKENGMAKTESGISQYFIIGGITLAVTAAAVAACVRNRRKETAAE